VNARTQLTFFLACFGLGVGNLGRIGTPMDVEDFVGWCVCLLAITLGAAGIAKVLRPDEKLPVDDATQGETTPEPRSTTRNTG